MILAEGSDWMNGFPELTGMALVGACFVFVLRYLLEKNTGEMRDLTKAIHSNTLVLLQVQREQIRHDSLCAGMKCNHPEPMDNEHYRMVATSYNAILEELKRASDAITGYLNRP